MYFAGLPPTTRFLRMCMLFLTPQDSLGKMLYKFSFFKKKEEIVSQGFLKPLPSGQTSDYLCRKTAESDN